MRFFSDLLPSPTGSLDFGSSALRWDILFANQGDLAQRLSIGTTAVASTGSSGSGTTLQPARTLNAWVNDHNTFSHVAGVTTGLGRLSSPAALLGPFANNNLTNWELRGGTVTSTLSAAVTVFQGSVRETYQPTQYLGTNKARHRMFVTLQTANVAGPHTAVIEFLDASNTFIPHATGYNYYTPYLTAEGAPADILNIMVEYKGSANAVWTTLFDGAPVWTGNDLWRGPALNSTTVIGAVNGIRFTLTLKQNSANLRVLELGWADNNAIQGVNMFGVLGAINTWQEDQTFLKSVIAAGLRHTGLLSKPSLATDSLGNIIAGTAVLGNGTVNVLPRWAAGGATLADSGLSDDGTTLTLASSRSLFVAGAGAFSGAITGSSNLTVTGTITSNSSVWANGVDPRFILNDTDGPADQKRADFIVAAGVLYGRFYTDDLLTSTNWLRVGRAATGHLAQDITFTASGSPFWNANLIWHAGNDGTGSGLDADLLDGQHAAAFAPLSHTQAWSTITGTPTTLSGYGITDALNTSATGQTKAGLLEFGTPGSTGTVRLQPGATNAGGGQPGYVAFFTPFDVEGSDTTATRRGYVGYRSGNRLMLAAEAGWSWYMSASFEVSGNVTAPRFVSTVAVGTAPLAVTSTTLVTNLNADLLDGEQGSAFHDWNNITNKPALTNGTVVSVGLSLPSIFTVTGSPVTTTGTLTGTLATQLANLVFAGPVSGGALAPTFRALVAADIPALAYVTGAGTAKRLAVWNTVSDQTNSLLENDPTNNIVSLRGAGSAAYFQTDNLGTGLTGFAVARTNKLRWFFGGDNSSESGSNAGTAWILRPYNDDGSAGVTALYVFRSTGVFQFASSPTVSGVSLLRGTLTANYLPKAGAAGVLGDSNVEDTGSNLNLRANTTVTTGALAVQSGGTGTAFLLDTEPTNAAVIRFRNRVPQVLWELGRSALNNFYLDAYTSAGAYINRPIQVSGTTRIIDLQGETHCDSLFKSAGLEAGFQCKADQFITNTTTLLKDGSLLVSDNQGAGKNALSLTYQGVLSLRCRDLNWGGLSIGVQGSDQASPPAAPWDATAGIQWLCTYIAADAQYEGILNHSVTPTPGYNAGLSNSHDGDLYMSRARQGQSQLATGATRGFLWINSVVSAPGVPALYATRSAGANPVVWNRALKALQVYDGTTWLSFTSGAGVGGTGAADYVARWSGASTLTTGLLRDDGLTVGVGVLPVSADRRFSVDASTTAFGSKPTQYGAVFRWTDDDTTGVATVRYGIYNSFRKTGTAVHTGNHYGFYDIPYITTGQVAFLHGYLSGAQLSENTKITGFFQFRADPSGLANGAGTKAIITDRYAFYARDFNPANYYTVTNSTGVTVEDQTNVTNAYGIRSLLIVGANKWNLHISGTAQNWIAGNLGVGAGKSLPAEVLDVAGNVKSTGFIDSSMLSTRSLATDSAGNIVAGAFDAEEVLDTRSADGAIRFDQNTNKYAQSTLTGMDLGTGDYTVVVTFKVPATTQLVSALNTSLFSVGGTAATSAGRLIAHFFSNTAVNLNVYQCDAAGAIGTNGAIGLAPYVGQVIQLALVRKSGVLSAFVDGQSVSVSQPSQLALPVGNNAGITYFNIGSQPGGNTYAFPEKIYSAQLYNRALSGADCQLLMLEGVAPGDYQSTTVPKITPTVLNGGFETGGGAPFANWSSVTSGTSTVNLDTSSPQAGANSCRLDVDANGVTGSFVGVRQTVVEAGRNYRISGYVKTNKSAGITQIQFNLNSISDLVYNLPVTVMPVDNWVAFSFEQVSGFVSLTGAGFFYLGRAANDASTSRWFDSVTLQRIGCLVDLDCGSGAGTNIPDRQNLFPAAITGTGHQWVNGNTTTYTPTEVVVVDRSLVASNATNASFSIIRTGDATKVARLFFQTGSLNRWSLGKNAVATSNENFSLDAWDGATWLGTAFEVSRLASAKVDFKVVPSVNGTDLALGAGTGSSETVTFVDTNPVGTWNNLPASGAAAMIPFPDSTNWGYYVMDVLPKTYRMSLFHYSGGGNAAGSFKVGFQVSTDPLFPATLATVTVLYPQDLNVLGRKTYSGSITSPTGNAPYYIRFGFSNTGDGTQHYDALLWTLTLKP